LLVYFYSISGYETPQKPPQSTAKLLLTADFCISRQYDLYVDVWLVLMNKATRKRQQRGQQQVRQLSIAATLITTLMILVFHDYKVAISTYLQLLISPIRFIISTQWLLIIAVSFMSASIGYILGRRQIQEIQVQTNRVQVQLICTRVWIQFFRTNPNGNF